jgi:hypothetical protein
VPTITLEVPTAGTEIEAGLHATNYADLQTLLNGGLDNSNIDAAAVLDATARVGVRKNSAGSTFSRRRINFIEGSGVTLTVADDSGGEEVDVTIASTAGTTDVAYAQVTASVSTTTHTEGAPLDIVSTGSVAFAAGDYYVEFNSPDWALGGSVNSAINIWVDGADIGRIAQRTTVTSSSSFPVNVKRKITLTAANHTIVARVWTAGGSNCVISAGAGGVGTVMPAYIRVTRA